MVYTIESGVKHARLNLQKLIIGITAFAFSAALAISIGSASAATTYTLTPSTYVGAAGDCGTDYPAGTPGGVVSKWDNTTGNPSPSLLLEKNVPTTDCSSAGATINGVSGITLTELNFDYKTDGHCGAGAPRYNVYTDNGTYYFFGCTAGTHTDAGSGWTKVEFGDADASPADGTTAWPGFGNAVVTGIDVVFDEGNDVVGQGTPGEVYLDNFSINGEIVSGPNTPTNKSDCKHGGWMNLTDAQGNPFENQGQCVAYVNGGGTHVHNLTKITNNNDIHAFNFNGQNANSGRAVVKNNTTGGNANSGNARNNNASNFNIIVSNF